MSLLRRGFLALLTGLHLAMGLCLPSHAADDTSVARYRFASASTAIPAWYEPTPVRVGIRSRGYMMRTGGVAFGATLTKPARYKDSKLMPVYDRTRPDGERLIMQVDGNAYTVKGIPDLWLAPIALFANASMKADQTLVTLTPDDAVQASEPPPGVIYEARLNGSVKDRAIGQELISLDMLLDPNDNSQSGRQGRAELQQLMDEASPESWLIHDVGSSISFQVRDGEFILTGSPHFFFWNETTKLADASDGDGGQVRPLQPISDKVTSRQAALLKSNPGYRAGLATMRLAALFRHVKQNSPAEWATFLDRMRPIAQAEPKVPTDYVIDTQLEQLVEQEKEQLGKVEERLEKWALKFPEAADKLEEILLMPDGLGQRRSLASWRREYSSAAEALRSMFAPGD